MIIALRPAWQEVTVDGVKYMNVDTSIVEQLLEACRKLWREGHAKPGWFQSGIAYQITGR